MASHMRTTMARQPEDLRRLLADPDPAARAAERLAGRRVFIVGTGTSWHAANHGAWLLREAGLDPQPVPAFDAALYGQGPGRDDALLLLSHTGAKRYTKQVLESARAEGIPTVTVGALGTGPDIETVEAEQSSAYTASHLGALMRLAQLARELGADLSNLDAVPDAVAAALAGTDALVVLDGGGPGADRVAAVAGAAEQVGVRVHRVTETSLGEPLSIFPLTVAVQRVALESAETLGADPDSFGYTLPGHEEAWEPLGF